MNNKLCVLITGIEKITGVHALQLDEFYTLRKYPSTQTSYYLDFDTKIQERGTAIKPTGNFAEFLTFLGIRGYMYRFDRHSGVDSSVDYHLHIFRRLNKSIAMPTIKPY